MGHSSIVHNSLIFFSQNNTKSGTGFWELAINILISFFALR